MATKYCCDRCNTTFKTKFGTLFKIYVYEASLELVNNPYAVTRLLKEVCKPCLDEILKVVEETKNA